MFKPLYDWIVVKELQPEQESIGGIVIPPTADKNKPVLKGQVVAVGDGPLTREGKQVPNETKPGDIVLFSAFNSRMRHEGEEIFILREGSILAVIEP